MWLDLTSIIRITGATKAQIKWSSYVNQHLGNKDLSTVYTSTRC